MFALNGTTSLRNTTPSSICMQEMATSSTKFHSFTCYYYESQQQGSVQEGWEGINTKWHHANSCPSASPIFLGDTISQNPHNKQN